MYCRYDGQYDNFYQLLKGIPGQTGVSFCVCWKVGMNAYTEMLLAGCVAYCMSGLRSSGL